MNFLWLFYKFIPFNINKKYKRWAFSICKLRMIRMLDVFSSIIGLFSSILLLLQKVSLLLEPLIYTFIMFPPGVWGRRSQSFELLVINFLTILSITVTIELSFDSLPIVLTTNSITDDYILLFNFSRNVSFDHFSLFNGN